MPSPNFLAKAFIAGFLIGHLFIPAQKSWVFNLVRSPAFDLIPPGLSYWNSANVGNEALQTQGVGQLLHLVADLNLPVSLLPLPGNLSVTSSLPTGSRFSPTRPQTSRPTFSRGNLTLVLPTNSNLVTHRPSATQTPFSTTPYYVYGSSAPGKLRIPVAMPLFRHTRSGYSRFALTVLLLLCVSVLLYHVTLLMYRKWRLEHKMRRLPERAVSMIITNFQDDPQSLKACSLVSRSWTIESQRYLFRKISLDSKRSSDFWFSSDSLGLANHVRSICMSMGAIVGTERGLSGFPRVETLRVAGWRRSQHSPPGWWSPLGQTVRHLELIRPKGTLQEILAFVSLFTTLESLHITPSNQPFRCEVRATRAGDPEAISIHLRMPRQPPVSGPGLTRSCTDDGVSLRLRESGSILLTAYMLKKWA